MGDNLKKNMIGALAWSSVNMFGIQAVQLVIGIILARVLMPDDFGLVGVLFIFIGLSTVLIDSGFAQGLIRKQDATNKDYSTVFFLNLMIAVVVYLVLFLVSPLIAGFFNHQELIPLSRVLFVAVLIFPFYLIQQVYLLKKPDYKSMAIVNIASVGLSGALAIYMALHQYGPWALVWQQITFHLFKAVLFPFFVKWKPDFCFSTETVKGLWKFSAPLLGQSLLNVIFNQLYMIIIGRFYPMKQAGYFAQANKYSETVNAATQGILNYSVFPMFSTIQDDKERSLRIYRKLTVSTTLLTFPLVAFLMIAAEPIIITLISEKWVNSILMFQLLLLANLFTPLYTINISVLNAGGESVNTLKLEIVKKVLISLSVVSTFSFGIHWMLIGFVIANTMAYMISMYYIKKSLNHYYRHQVLDILLVLLIVAFTGAICYFINFLNVDYIYMLIFMIFSFIFVYVSSLLVFKREVVDEITQKITKTIQRK